MYLKDGTHKVPLSAAIKIEFFKGASKGENEYIHCHSPLVGDGKYSISQILIF